MIPQFPQFKKLELSDQEEIEKITSLYLPYSDFDFENMWAWDINDGIKISSLNGNLIYLAKDVFRNETICSYLGSNKVNETIAELLHFLNTTEIGSKSIKLIPEDSLKGMDFSKYFIEIDLNSCDYIYELNKLSQYEGNRFMQKRGRTNTFVRNHPEAVIKVIDLQDQKCQQELLNVNSLWVKNKLDQKGLSDDREFLAIERFIKADFKNVHCVAVYDKGLIGYAIFSLHRQDYVINHFIKADIQYKGVYEFLMRESARILSAKGYEYLNYLEDMGIEGLRKAKLAYRPLKFLRKYTVNKL